jgi:hypothetical protein
MFPKLIAELRYTDTFYQRLSLAFACTFYGFAAWNMLGIVFIIVGMLAWWRLFDRRPRIFVGTLVNLCVAALWITIASANLFVHRAPLADNVCEIMVCLTALFVLTRTDLTSADKGAA